jgi:hypothetical protein
MIKPAAKRIATTAAIHAFIVEVKIYVLSMFAGRPVLDQFEKHALSR